MVQVLKEYTNGADISIDGRCYRIAHISEETGGVTRIYTKISETWDFYADIPPNDLKDIKEYCKTKWNIDF